MTTTFKFICCCSDRFKKIYGKLMRDLNKQYGGAKKARESRTVCMTETELKYVGYDRFCPKCKRSYKHNVPVLATQINLVIEHGN